MDHSGKKGGPSAVVVCCLLLLLLPLLSYASDASEATKNASDWPTCADRSKTFKGECLVDPPCNTACLGEGKQSGLCQDKQCICLRPCTSP